MGGGVRSRLSPAWCPALPDEEESELIVMLSFLALGHRLSCFLCVLPRLMREEKGEGSHFPIWFWFGIEKSLMREEKGKGSHFFMKFGYCDMC